MKREYESPRAITESEVFQAIQQDDLERLRTVCIDLGFNHENWKFTQDISVQLSEHPDDTVRGNSLFGIEYAARFKGKVEKNIVKPVLLRAVKDESSYVVSRAIETIEAVNHLMGWSIGGAKHQKEIERRYINYKVNEQNKLQ